MLTLHTQKNAQQTEKFLLQKMAKKERVTSNKKWDRLKDEL